MGLSGFGSWSEEVGAVRCFWDCQRQQAERAGAGVSSPSRGISQHSGARRNEVSGKRGVILRSEARRPAATGSCAPGRPASIRLALLACPQTWKRRKPRWVFYPRKGSLGPPYCRRRRQRAQTADTMKRASILRRCSVFPSGVSPPFRVVGHRVGPLRNGGQEHEHSAPGFHARDGFGANRSLYPPRPRKAGRPRRVTNPQAWASARFSQ